MNKVLCIVTLVILKELAQVIINYLAIGLLNELKKLFIFVLRKEGKKDHLLLGAYRPIVLKATLAKLAKKVIITRIIKKAEAKLLLT